MENVGLMVALAGAMKKAPTAEQVSTAVDEWLEDHPEATTTVQDGAVTNAKLASSFVTPGTASAYSSSATYAVGDYVFYGGTLYRCTTAITTAETWTAAHWTVAVLGDDVSDLKSAIIQPVMFSAWTKATFNADGLINAAGNGAVSNAQKLYESSLIHVGTGCRFIIAFYDGSQNYIGKVAANGSINKTGGDWRFFTSDTIPQSYAPENAGYYLVCALPTDGTVLTSENVTSWANAHIYIIENIASIAYFNSFNTEETFVGDVSDYFHKLFWTHYSHIGSGEYGPNNLRNAIVTPVHFLADITISCPPTLKFAYQLFDGFELGETHLLFASPWVYTSVIIPAGSYFCMIVANKNDSLTDSTTQDGLQFAVSMTADDVYSKLLNNGNNEQASFAVGCECVKREINTKHIGTLTYAQSFCKYNDKYYSTDGSNIGVQNSDFSEITTKALAVGHGNAFQLGNNGKAYISGWDNQTIYVIDMETLEIDNTIILPTTGYTTAVIDDLNGIAYIFQRDSFPSTVANYKFIVYDYQNEQVKSERIINAFSAMQAADFYNGKIAILWGLGTTESPVGCAVYNTAGDMLSELTLDIIKATEPEGIFFDRSTGELSISTVTKDVYEIF